MNRGPLFDAGITLAASVTFGLTARAEPINTIRSCGKLVVAIDPGSSPFGPVEIMATSPQIAAISIRKGDNAPKATFDERVGVNLANGKLNHLRKRYDGVGLPEQRPA